MKHSPPRLLNWHARDLQCFTLKKFANLPNIAQVFVFCKLQVILNVRLCSSMVCRLIFRVCQSEFGRATVLQLSAIKPYWYIKGIRQEKYTWNQSLLLCLFIYILTTPFLYITDQTFVFTDKKLALQTVKKFSGARFKCFKTKEDAEKFSNLAPDDIASPWKPTTKVILVLVYPKFVSTSDDDNAFLTNN